MSKKRTKILLFLKMAYFCALKCKESRYAKTVYCTSADGATRQFWF
jgi:hypothetical protein